MDVALILGFLSALPIALQPRLQQGPVDGPLLLPLSWHDVIGARIRRIQIRADNGPTQKSTHAQTSSQQGPVQQFIIRPIVLDGVIQGRGGGMLLAFASRGWNYASGYARTHVIVPVRIFGGRLEGLATSQQCRYRCR